MAGRTETDAGIFNFFSSSSSKNPSTIDSGNLPDEKKEQNLTVIDKDADYYNMNHSNRGYALIFNHYEFDSVPRRNGTEKDCDDIEKVLKELKFDVKVYSDYKYAQIYDVIYDVAAMDHSKSDCLIVVVMTHGDNGVIYAKDHAYPPEMLWSTFSGDKCPTLAGKPKLFFIQACRGDETDSGAEVQSRTSTDNSASKAKYTIPSMADILVMYSAFPGHFAFRSTTQGSWFIQSLCEELRNRAKTDDILKILTFVNRRVAINYESFMPSTRALNKKKQVGVIFSTLTRQLNFCLNETN